MEKLFNFGGATLGVKNENGALKVTVSDGTYAASVNVPATNCGSITKAFESASNEALQLTEAQLQAINKRWGDTPNNGEQPF